MTDTNDTTNNDEKLESDMNDAKPTEDSSVEETKEDRKTPNINEIE